MRVRTLALLCLAVLLVAALAAAGVTRAVGSQAMAASAQFVPASGSPGPANPAQQRPTGRAQTAGQAGPPAPTLLIPADPNAITAPGTNFFGWALLDRHSGEMSGSANRETATSTTESMIKAWIAADYLRRQTATPSTAALNDLHTMIVNSDDNIAYTYYEKNGGDASITDLISVCALHNTKKPYLADRWSYTTMSPADAVRMGMCIADGRAAGRQWTDWLLTTMRQVQGSVDQQQATSGGGRWGILDGLPAGLVAQTAIKNGWTAQVYDHNWHVNCLAVHPDWVLAIEIHYPWTSPDNNWQNADNLRQGAQTCAAVTKSLVGTPDR